MNNRPTPTGDYWTQWIMLPGVTIGRYRRANGMTDYWRREPFGKWTKLPHWWHPDTFAYQPWRPQLQHSCGRP